MDAPSHLGGLALLIGHPPCLDISLRAAECPERSLRSPRLALLPSLR